jgi:arginine:agmatine antiporter
MSDPVAAAAGDRKIGPVLAAALVAGNMVGSGVFLLPATLGAIGSISLVGWVLATLGAFATAAVFADLGRISRSLEGLVGYAREGLGGFAGFALALIYWMGAWVGTVAIAVAAAGYLAVFIPKLAGPMPLAITAAGAICLFTLVNLIGARTAARFGGLSLIAGLAPILAVAILGWFWFDPKIFAASWNVSGLPAFNAVQTSLISAFWAYEGVESAAVAAAVVRNPQRNVPIATYAGTAIAATVYIAASAAVMGLAPAHDLAQSTAPFAFAVTRVLGAGIGGAVALCALIKTCGSLSGWMLIIAESGRAGADVYLFPGRFAPDAKGGVPRRLLIGMAAVMSAAAVMSTSKTLGSQFGLLINVSTLWTIIPYAICSLALISLIRAWPASRAKRVMQALAGLALVFNLWLVSTGDPISLWLTAGLIAATVVLWFAIARRRMVRGEG